MIWNGFCLLSENQTEKQSKGRKRKLFFHSFRSHIFRHFLQCIPVSCTRLCRTMLRNKIEYLIYFYENDTPHSQAATASYPKSPTSTVTHTIEKISGLDSTFYLLPGYKHPFCIFAGYRIRMKREILYQRIAGTIAWQTDTLFYILTGTDIRINQHLRTGNEIKREITVRIQP